MGTRAEAIFERMQRLIPPPDAEGWHYTRLKLVSAAMGAADFVGSSTMDQQASEAERQLELGVLMKRVDSRPTDWTLDDAASWQFSPDLTSGAAGYFLDVWGRTLSVPRMPAEDDYTYAGRIVTDVSRATTTNIGLAQAIDAALGVVGTTVIDAEDIIKVVRLNARFRANSSWHFNSSGTLRSPLCCFVVQVPSPVGDVSAFTELVNARKAAGTRLAGIMLGANVAPIIRCPSMVLRGETITATLAASRPNATAYNWSVTGGTIVGGAGTANVSIQASSDAEVMTIELTVVENGVTSPRGRRNVILLASTTNCPTIAYAGDGPFDANAPSGYVYEWTITGGYILSDPTSRDVQFSVGEANQIATLTCSINQGASILSTDIKIIPYTSTETITTPSIPVGGRYNFELPLGWAWDLDSVTVSRPCWLRIYNTDSDRNADSDRLAAVDPKSTLNIVWEGFFTSGSLTIPDAPEVSGVNGDKPRSKTAYLSVVNRDTDTGPITISVTRTETKTSGVF